MSGLAAQLKGTAASDLSFSVIFPPGWAKYGVTAEAEAALVQNVRDIYKDGGRPDIAADVRTRLHVYFSRLRRIKAQAFYLPVKRVDDLVLPVALAAVPYTAPPGTTIQDSVRSVAKVSVDDVEYPFGTAYRWLEIVDRVEREKGVSSMTITYLLPLPGEKQRKGIMMSYSILHLTGEHDAEFTQVLADLFDAIMGTFRWKTS